MTHRFHPLSGRDFEFVVHRRNWSEDRVYCRDEDGELFSLPVAWTDVAPVDPFVVIAAGRCSFTAGGLLAVADLIDRLRSHPDSGTVRAENLIRGSDQRACSLSRPAVMIIYHVPAVRVSLDRASGRVASAVPA